MAQHDLIADSLNKAKRQARDGILRSSDLSATDRTRLISGGWLKRIVRGYYVLGTPGREGESGVWYGHDFRSFARLYMADRFGKRYCLSAKDSIEVHIGEPALSGQIVVNTRNQSAKVDLPFKSSILVIPGYLPDVVEEADGLRVMTLAEALCRVPVPYFEANPLKAAVALRSVRDPASSIGKVLLGKGMPVVAGRVVAAYRVIGQAKIADNIKAAMTAAGHKLVESNPFTSMVPDFGGPRETSPQALRVRAMWATMREKVLKVFPADPGISKNTGALLQGIKDVYRHDAYNSLSIEGYDVTEGLIEKVRTGAWDPITNERDSRTKGALAAKGYADAFNRVLESVSRALRGEPAGDLAESDLHGWYTALFGPSVRAGIIEAADLAGYRSGPVYIRGANHVPPNAIQVPAIMEELFALLKEEKSAAVRAVLGHFIFVHIHPFMDGNGRTSRFLMNLMFVSGGWPWTIIRAQQSRRNRYFAALDEAHVTRTEIHDFAKFLREEMNVDWSAANKGAHRPPPLTPNR
jgi:hypothetical protein